MAIRKSRPRKFPNNQKSQHHHSAVSARSLYIESSHCPSWLGLASRGAHFGFGRTLPRLLLPCDSASDDELHASPNPSSSANLPAVRARSSFSEALVLGKSPQGMLERVPVSAESAAFLLLRHFDRPCRSTRVLDPKFWRHATFDTSSPAWWPLYLQKIRQIPHRVELPVASPTSIPSDHPSGSRRRRYNPKPPPAVRSYTISAPLSQSQAPQKKVYDTFGLSEEITAEHLEADVAENSGKRRNSFRIRRQQDEHDSGEHDSAEHDFGEWGAFDNQPQKNVPVGTLEPSIESEWDLSSPLASIVQSGNVQFDHTQPQPEPYWRVSDEDLSPVAQRERRLTRLVESEDRSLSQLGQVLQAKTKQGPEELDRAWQLFVSLENQQAVAQDVFPYLAQAGDERHIARALETFRIIPRQDRALEDYQRAIQLELKRSQYRVAMNLAFEANIRGFDLVPHLLADFVENLLWLQASELCYRNRTARRDMAAFASAPPTSSQANMLQWTDLVKRCFELKDLHLKVLSLASRLRTADASLLEHRNLLIILCQRLAEGCVQSPNTIKSLPPAALLALYNLQDELGDMNLQKKAFHTILQLENRSAKPDLALMAYRNYRYAKPDNHITRWELGGLIALCVESNYALDIYPYLLGEFTKLIGQPDALAYQKVLTACARHGNLAAVQRILDQCLSSHRSGLTISHLSPLIYACAVNGDPSAARQQFDRIKTEFGLDQNTTCWNMLMLAHARSSDDLSAFDVFDEMSQNQVKADSYTIGTLLGVCAAHSDLASAFELLSEANELQVAISVPMINTVVDICLANHDVHQAISFAVGVSKSGTTESLTRLWNSIAQYSATRGDIKTFLYVRRQMSRFNVSPNSMTYAAVVTVLTLTGKTLQAVAALREMHHNHGMTIIPFHYALILDGFIREKNRDMVVVIATEMARRFPHMTSSANRALSLLRAQPPQSSKAHEGYSAELLAALLEDLFVPNTVSPRPEQPFGVPHVATSVASLYFDMVMDGLISTGSYESAERLLQKLGDLNNQSSGDKSVRSGKVLKILLSRMDLAIARADWATVDQLWLSFFERACVESRSIEQFRERRHPSNRAGDCDDSKVPAETALRPPPLPEAWRTMHSKPLNKWLGAMATQDRVAEVVSFVESRFLPQGFRMTGYNWNKYTQVLCKSTRMKHRVMAFKLTERYLLNRAQSWKLLARGLMRQKTTDWFFTKQDMFHMPVLEKKTKYSVAKRTDLIRLSRHRAIPTYTTMVHLAAVLMDAQRKAANLGSTLELRLLTDAGPRTKRFVQQLPYVKDKIQAALIRNQPVREDHPPRPRSETSFRNKTQIEGILGTSSALDHVPVTFLDDIEDIIAPKKDLSLVLNRDRAPQIRYEKATQDVLLAEQLFGHIDRGPKVHAAKGRYETDAETTARVLQEEQGLLRKIQAMRNHLSQRYIDGEPFPRDFESPVSQPPNDNSEEAIFGASPLRKPAERSQILSDAFREPPTQARVAGQDQMDKHKPLSSFSVAQQLDVLQDEAATKTSITNKPRHALSYMERRRIRRLTALKQRRQALRNIEAIGAENFSDRALRPRSAAGRRMVLFQVAQRRKRQYLEYEAARRAGKRLDPLPTTRKGFWAALLKRGQLSPVRFEADLGRNKFRYLVRLGKAIELRQPRLTPPLAERRFVIQRQRPPRPLNQLLFENRQRKRRRLPPVDRRPEHIILAAEARKQQIPGYEKYHPLLGPR